MDEREMDEFPVTVTVRSESLAYVVRYITTYDQIPSDEAPHDFWNHMANLAADLAGAQGGEGSTTERTD